MKEPKYSDNFNRDYNWYLLVRRIFSFDGKVDIDIPYLKEGSTIKHCFWTWDSQGKIIPCIYPTLASDLLRTKASVNFHIKMYAQGRADGTFPREEFIELCNRIYAPDWFYEAVERQKIKYYSL